MTGGGGHVPPSVNGGEFLLQLLQKPPHQTPIPFQSQPPAEALPHDPAVAAVGPTIPFPSTSLFSPPSNGPNRHSPQPPPPWPQYQSTPLPFAPHSFFPQNPNPNANFSPSSLSLSAPVFNHAQQHYPQSNYISNRDDMSRVGFLGMNSFPRLANQNDQNLIFGTLYSENLNFGTPLSGNVKENLAHVGHFDGTYGKGKEILLANARNGSNIQLHYSEDVNRKTPGNFGALRGVEQERSGNGGGTGGLGKQSHGGNYRAVVTPPGFTSKSMSGGNKEQGTRRKSFEQNADKGKNNIGDMKFKNNDSNKDKREGMSSMSSRNRKNNGDIRDHCGVSSQLDDPGLRSGNNLHSASISNVEESLRGLHREVGASANDFQHEGQNILGKSGNDLQGDLDGLEDQLVDSLGLDDGSEGKKNKAKHQGSRDKDYRSDKRGKWLLGQRLRILKRQTECRNDINRLNVPFIAIYESLIPAKEEKDKQKQLLSLLEKLVCKEWPEARLYVYGSCANSFGFSKSDIDVCLAIQDEAINKSEILLKLAEILQSDNLQNVQALTHARVPIVKLMDPVTGISCDICVNNVLAVINTKLLRDYARIDARLRQLAFIVKHWAKTRGVNETYHGTLSSYAYVLMCIHFLQQRRPAILPCLQGMEPTYSVSAENVECAYFDQVEKLEGFGAHNGESIAQLVWAFFNYWAYCHDYANDVISVRTGSTLSKLAKNWTRRIGNDRHLICIEDPFLTSHDLGRVVDKFSIRVLREEFERAAEVMQYDPDPCVKLFEPYVPN